jgi:hypothetical protein
MVDTDCGNLVSTVQPPKRMKTSQCAAIAVIAAVFATSALLGAHTSVPLTPVRNTTNRGGYIIDTVGDTLSQASPQNARLIIRVFGPDKKIVKPAQIALIDKSGAAIQPVFREDRKTGHEENTGLPLSVSGSSVGVDLNKIFGPKGSYAYTKVDWPKQVFTADKRLQIMLANGQTFVLSLTSLAK